MEKQLKNMIKMALKDGAIYPKDTSDTFIINGFPGYLTAGVDTISIKSQRTDRLLFVLSDCKDLCLKLDELEVKDYVKSVKAVLKEIKEFKKEQKAKKDEGKDEVL